MSIVVFAALMLSSSVPFPGPTKSPVDLRASAATRITLVVFTEQATAGRPVEPVDLAAVRKAAEQGDAKAQRALGDAYAMGIGVLQDRTEAFAWYRKAAGKGDPFALGRVYADGEGVPQDYALALTWYRKAAEQGDVAAQTAIGFLYYSGGSIFRPVKMPKDYAQAFIWFQRAAELGDAKAQFALGALYLEGQGAPMDIVEAHKWMSLAVPGFFPGTQEAQTTLSSVEKMMTSSQIAEAQKRASAWRESYNKRRP